MLEAADFHPGRSGRDHLFSLALALGHSGGGNWFLGRERAAAQRVDAVLELVELTAAGRRRVGSYSLGMRQRLGLAGALLGDPELLILDEPANGLDPEGVRWLREFMRGFAAEGKTVLVSSHVLAEVAADGRPGHDHQQGQARHLRAARPADHAYQRRRARTRAGRAPLQKELRSARHPLVAARRRRAARRGRAERRRSASSPSPPACRCTSWCRKSSSLEDVFLELTAEEPS